VKPPYGTTELPVGKCRKPIGCFGIVGEMSADRLNEEHIRQAARDQAPARRISLAFRPQEFDDQTGRLRCRNLGSEANKRRQRLPEPGGALLDESETPGDDNVLHRSGAAAHDVGCTAAMVRAMNLWTAFDVEGAASACAGQQKAIACCQANRRRFSVQPYAVAARNDEAEGEAFVRIEAHFKGNVAIKADKLGPNDRERAEDIRKRVGRAWVDLQMIKGVLGH